MNRRDYPRVGSWGGNPKWLNTDRMRGPLCSAPGCTVHAVRQPWIEVNWFRGDDVRSGPLCRTHSEARPIQLLEWAEAWAAANKRRNDEAQARAAQRKAAKATGSEA